MRGLFSSSWRRNAEWPDVDGPICVIGDVHGRRDLLQRLLDRVEAEAPEATVVTVGDYVDRGPDSRGVLELLAARDHVSLMGNHEDMLLRFLDDPVGAGPLWLFNGGVQTLQSFGIDAAFEGPGSAALAAAGAELGREMGDLGAWVRARPLWWRSGDLLVCHAGGDPAAPPEAQAPRDLLWGHPAFGRTRRRDGLWVAHGHTIVAAPFAAGGRIATDTGAVFTGRLTAALIYSGKPVRFLRT